MNKGALWAIIFLIVAVPAFGRYVYNAYLERQYFEMSDIRRQAELRELNRLDDEHRRQETAKIIKDMNSLDYLTRGMRYDQK